MLYIFGGLGMLIAVFVLQIPAFEKKETAEDLKIFFFIHPGYAFAQVLYNTARCLLLSILKRFAGRLRHLSQLLLSRVVLRLNWSLCCLQEAWLPPSWLCLHNLAWYSSLFLL